MLKRGGGGGEKVVDDLFLLLLLLLLLKRILLLGEGERVWLGRMLWLDDVGVGVPMDAKALFFFGEARRKDPPGISPKFSEGFLLFEFFAIQTFFIFIHHVNG